MSHQPRSVTLALVLTSIITSSVPPLTIDAQRSDGLKIVVIEGEGAVNIIQQKTAVNPVVEVRDRNNLPVSGVAVTFSVGGQGATFAGGASTVTLTTNAAGRVAATGLTPTVTGPVTINATAVVNGQTIAATITQTNFATAQAAAQAAASAGASTAAGGGGGLSGATLGIIGGVAAAGAGVAVAAGGSPSTSPTPSTQTSNPTVPVGSPPTVPTPVTPVPPPNSPPTINSASITPNVALAGMDTPISLQVQASDADSDTLTYLWEFPDGSTSDQRALTRIFREGGLHTIRINVRDGRTTTSVELTLTMKTMTGTWAYSAGPTTTFVLNQNGTSISGTNSGGTPGGSYTCPLTGSVRSSAPHVILDRPDCRISDRGTLASARFEFQAADAAIDILSGFNITDGQSYAWTIIRR